MAVTYTDEERAAIYKLRAAENRIDNCPTRMFYKGALFQKKIVTETSIGVFDEHGLRKLIPIRDYLRDT